MKLPITILLPTRNSMRLLPDHLRQIQPLLPLVNEVVHVDSGSTDGTVECVQKGIGTIRYFDQPPGLYQSWNFGIRQAASTYVYVSTIGDAMEAGGLKRLFEVAEKFGADAVVSVPSMLDENGSPLEKRWPVHRIIDDLGIKEPTLLNQCVAFAEALGNMPDVLGGAVPGSILNSSASNLYRAATFVERPFPTDFGTTGDVTWGILNALETKIAIVPESFSTFLIHEKTYSLKDYEVSKPRDIMLKAAFQAAANAGLSSRQEPIARLVWKQLEQVKNLYDAQARLEEARRHGPWILNPGAWKIRRERNELKRVLAANHQEILRLALAR